VTCAAAHGVAPARQAARRLRRSACVALGARRERGVESRHKIFIFARTTPMTRLSTSLSPALPAHLRAWPGVVAVPDHDAIRLSRRIAVPH